MNNIYVDELPNICDDCPFGRCEYYRYDSLSKYCPLKPLSDRLSEERKKVVQEIRDYVCNKNRHIDLERANGVDTFFYSIHCRSFLEKLDQIERGE